MKKTALLLCIVAGLFACKNEKVKTTFDTKSYEQVKESLADKERNNPARFLKVENRDRKNLIGQTVVIGHITNNATVCWYKDIDIKLSFFSKTGAKLDEQIETVYENIAPGKTIKFKTRSFAPKGADSVAVQVLKATADTLAAK